MMVLEHSDLILTLELIHSEMNQETNGLLPELKIILTILNHLLILITLCSMPMITQMVTMEILMLELMLHMNLETNGSLKDYIFEKNDDDFIVFF